MRYSSCGNLRRASIRGGKARNEFSGALLQKLARIQRFDLYRVAVCSYDMLLLPLLPAWLLRQVVDPLHGLYHNATNLVLSNPVTIGFRALVPGLLIRPPGKTLAQNPDGLELRVT